MKDLDKKRHVFILAGGSGTRFWPLSRAGYPKQFLDLGASPEPMISATARRIKKLKDLKTLNIITNKEIADETHRLVPDANIIAEPIGRNTAASVGLASIVAASESSDSVVVILPADHSVSNEQALVSVLDKACDVAASVDAIVTVGITPSKPHTGYGYIQHGDGLNGFPECYWVKHFYEKPNLERAESYCRSGDFYWNSGMFVFKVGVMLRAINECLPAMYKNLIDIQASLGSDNQEARLNQIFPSLEAISIDVGVLEHIKNRVVVRANDFGWNDVGSWDAWAEQFESDGSGNLFRGDVVSVDSESCIVRNELKDGIKPRCIALLGVKDLVVIDVGDALLICPKARVQEIKKLVEELKKLGRSELV